MMVVHRLLAEQCQSTASIAGGGGGGGMAGLASASATVGVKGSRSKGLQPQRTMAGVQVAENRASRGIPSAQAGSQWVSADVPPTHALGSQNLGHAQGPAHQMEFMSQSAHQYQRQQQQHDPGHMRVNVMHAMGGSNAEDMRAHAAAMVGAGGHVACGQVNGMHANMADLAAIARGGMAPAAPMQRRPEALARGNGITSAQPQAGDMYGQNMQGVTYGAAEMSDMARLYGMGGGAMAARNMSQMRVAHSGMHGGFQGMYPPDGVPRAQGYHEAAERMASLRGGVSSSMEQMHGGRGYRVGRMGSAGWGGGAAMYDLEMPQAWDSFEQQMQMRRELAHRGMMAMESGGGGGGGDSIAAHRPRDSHGSGLGTRLHPGEPAGGGDRARTGAAGQGGHAGGSRGEAAPSGGRPPSSHGADRVRAHAAAGVFAGTWVVLWYLVLCVRLICRRRRRRGRHVRVPITNLLCAAPCLS